MKQYPNLRHYPIVMSMILLTIIDMSTKGGATNKQLKTVYESYCGRFPHERTIRRIINKLNEGIDPIEPAIIIKKHGLENRYIFTKGGYIYSYMAI